MRVKPGSDSTIRSTPLPSKLLAIPALPERHLAYVAEIAEKSVNWHTLEVRVKPHQVLIRRT